VAFPYPPLTFLAEAPAFAAFGDVRYALLASMIGAAWLIARRSSGQARRAGGGAGALPAPHAARGGTGVDGAVGPLLLRALGLRDRARRALGPLRRRHRTARGEQQYAVLFVVPLALSMPAAVASGSPRRS